MNRGRKLLLPLMACVSPLGDRKDPSASPSPSPLCVGGLQGPFLAHRLPGTSPGASRHFLTELGAEKHPTLPYTHFQDGHKHFHFPPWLVEHPAPVGLGTHPPRGAGSGSSGRSLFL